MEQNTMRYAADKHFRRSAVIARAHNNKVGRDRRGAVENEGSRVLDFTQRPDGGGLSRQQGTAALNCLATGIDHGLAEFVVSLHIEGSGHEGRLEHAQVYTMYEHDLFRTVEQSDL